MGKYSLDITSKNNPFINIEVKDDRVLLGAYENGKIERKLFFINKEQLELLINGLMAVNALIHNEVDFSQFIYQGKQCKTALGINKQNMEATEAKRKLCEIRSSLTGDEHKQAIWIAIRAIDTCIENGFIVED